MNIPGVDALLENNVLVGLMVVGVSGLIAWGLGSYSSYLLRKASMSQSTSSFVAKIVRYGLFIVCIGAYLLYVFDKYELLTGYVLKFGRAGLLGFVAYYGTSFLYRFIHSYLKSFYPDELRASLIAKVVSYMFLFAVGSAMLHEFGVNLAALLGAAGIVGIAIAYASQASVSNLISGLFLMLERPFKLKDTLVVGGIEGTLTEVNLFAITLEKSDGTVVRIPNEKLLKDAFTNLTKLPNRRYTMKLKVDYQENPTRVLDTVAEVVRDNKQCLATPAPLIRIDELSGNYMQIVVGAWAKQENFSGLKKSLPVDLKNAFEQHGIKMAVYKQGD